MILLFVANSLNFEIGYLIIGNELRLELPAEAEKRPAAGDEDVAGGGRLEGDGGGRSNFSLYKEGVGFA